MQAAQQERECSFCLGLRPASGLQGSTQTAPKSVKTVVFCAWEHTAQEKDFLLRRSYSPSCKDQGPQLHVTEKSNSVVQFLFVLLQDNGGGQKHTHKISLKKTIITASFSFMIYRVSSPDCRSGPLILPLHHKAGRRWVQETT